MPESLVIGAGLSPSQLIKADYLIVEYSVRFQAPLSSGVCAEADDLTGTSTGYAYSRRQNEF